MQPSYLKLFECLPGATGEEEETAAASAANAAEALPCKKLRGPRGGEALSGWSWAEEGATAFGPSEAKGRAAVRDGSGGSSDSTVKQDELRVPLLLQPRPVPVLFGLVKLQEEAHK